MKKIVVAAGGTGGHVFPALCLARELKNNGHNVIFATDKRGLKYLSEFKTNPIIQKINTSSRFKLYFSLVINILFCLFRIMRIKPDLVIGFGGYPAVPIVFAAQILKVKTVIHEQNAIIGKANKLLSKMADLVVTSFPGTKGLQRSKKVLYLGNPTRFENEYANSQYSENDVLTILIFGGSQGAKVFSSEVVSAICDLSKSRKIRVFHQGRSEDVEFIKSQYNAFNVENTVSAFFENMDTLYKTSDFVISRSGASSIFEIIGFAKPNILIPYMKSINGDQLENANYLKKHNAAIVVIEDENIKLELEKALNEIVSQFEAMHDNLKKLRILNVTERFAEIVDGVINITCSKP